jgi:hypothetical protein
MNAVVYHVVTGEREARTGDLQAALLLCGHGAQIEHSFWRRCPMGWCGVVWFAGADPDEASSIAAIALAFAAVNPAASLTVLRASPLG